MDLSESVLKEMGFENEDQLKRMILDVDLPDPRIFNLFQEWKRGPMTRVLLQEILDTQVTGHGGE